ncbi:MAG: hypothetical protein ABSA96_17805 [Candidatus Acidiferrales bacterium]|jgi:hypothetical protein
MHGIYLADPYITWTSAEKKLARKAFEKAYEAECATITAEANRMIASAKTPSDIWLVHDYLSERRKAVDLIYDYRYSVLIQVFARLLRDGWLTEADFDGIDKEKVDSIIQIASL